MEVERFLRGLEESGGLKGHATMGWWKMKGRRGGQERRFGSFAMLNGL